MKTSERILSYCAIIITLVAIAIWVKFTRAESRPIPPPPLPPNVKTNRPTRSQPPTVTTTPTEFSTEPVTQITKTPPLAPAQESPEQVMPKKPASSPIVSSRNYAPLTKVFAGGATIRGRALFSGDAPKAKKIKMDADPPCAAMHGAQPAFSEEVVVNPDGTLRNVFVYIATGIMGAYEAPKTPVTLNQAGCSYVPHVFGMQANQLLVIKNSDDTLHNIHALPRSNEEFNKGQPAGSADLKKTFLNPEVMVKFKCDVHPWMTAYVGVLEHPFYSVTGEDGAFAIGALPAGNYTVAAWHEKYGVASQQVAVAEQEVREIDFKYQSQ